MRHFDWEVTYDADGYIGLLGTFSGHIAMEPWQRCRLYSEIRPDWMSEQTGCFAVAVAPSSTSRGDATFHTRHDPIR